MSINLTTLSIEANDDERIFFCTDGHGEFTFLMQSLRLIGYKPPIKNGDKIMVRDRLFGCGDMIDRGADSMKMLEFFRYDPSAFLLLGNHEDCMVDAMDKGLKSSLALWEANGGEWHHEHSEYALKDMAVWLKSLPDVVELIINNGESKIGMAHAGYPLDLDWDEFKALVSEPSKDLSLMSSYRDKLLKDKTDEKLKLPSHINGLSAMLHGHTIQRGDISCHGNRLYFDTGAGIYSEDNFSLTILEYKKGGEVLGLFEKYQFYIDPYTKMVEMR